MKRAVMTTFLTRKRATVRDTQAHAFGLSFRCTKLFSLITRFAVGGGAQVRD